MGFGGRGTGSFKLMKRSGRYQASNNTFDPATGEGRSYSHWLYVRRIKGKNVFNAYSYSASTSRHQGNMRSLLESLGVKIHLEIETRESLSRFEETALPYLYRKVFFLEMLCKRERAKPDDVKHWKREIKGIEKEIKLARSLGAKITRDKMKALRVAVMEEEKQRLEERRARAAERRKLSAGERELKASGAVFDPNAFIEPETKTEETANA